MAKIGAEVPRASEELPAVLLSQERLQVTLKYRGWFDLCCYFILMITCSINRTRQVMFLVSCWSNKQVMWMNPAGLAGGIRWKVGREGENNKHTKTPRPVPLLVAQELCHVRIRAHRSCTKGISQEFPRALASPVPSWDTASLKSIRCSPGKFFFSFFNLFVCLFV